MGAVAGGLRHGVLPDAEIAGEEARLRLHQPGGIGRPVFADPPERLDDLGRRLGDEVGGLSLLVRLQIGGERAPALFDRPGDVARKRLRVPHHVGGGRRVRRRAAGCLQLPPFFARNIRPLVIFEAHYRNYNTQNA